MEALAGKNQMAPELKVDGIKAENIIEMSIATLSPPRVYKETQAYKDAKQKYLGDAYLVFDGQPQNIKLADGSNKTFDAAQESIRFQSFEGDEGQANFDRWKGDNKLYSASDIQDIKNGEPVVVDVYHGTTNDFYEFDASIKGNVEGHLGKVNYFTSDEGDAGQNYQSDGADITQRIETESERIFESLSDEGLNDELSQEDVRLISEMYGVEIEVGEDLEEASRSLAEKQLVGTDEKVLNVYVKLNNPAVIGAIDERGRGTSYMETIPESEIEGEIEGATEEIAEEYDVSIEEAKEDYSGEIKSRAIENYTQSMDHPLISALQDAINDNTYDANFYSANEILADLATQHHQP